MINSIISVFSALICMQNLFVKIEENQNSKHTNIYIYFNMSLDFSLPLGACPPERLKGRREIYFSPLKKESCIRPFTHIYVYKYVCIFQSRQFVYYIRTEIRAHSEGMTCLKCIHYIPYDIYNTSRFAARLQWLRRKRVFKGFAL